MDQLWTMATTWYASRLEEVSRRPQAAEMRGIFRAIGLDDPFWDPRSDRSDPGLGGSYGSDEAKRAVYARPARTLQRDRWARIAGPPGAGTGLSESIRPRIPEGIVEADRAEDPAHLRGLRAARDLLQARRVPGRRHRPELVHGDERAQRHSSRVTPRPDPFLRPEEEHVRSGEDEIVPPLRCGNEAVEQPRRRLRPIDADLEDERLAGFLAPRVHTPRSVERRGHSQGVPCAVGEVRGAAHLHAMLCRHAGERRGHADRGAVGLEQQQTLAAEILIRGEHARDVQPRAPRDLFGLGTATGLGEVAIDRELHS